MWQLLTAGTTSMALDAAQVLKNGPYRLFNLNCAKTVGIYEKFIIFSLILIKLTVLIVCFQVNEPNIVSPIAKVVSITITRNPTKTAYYVNEAFDPTGLVVTATYSDSSSKSVSNYSLSSPSMDTVGQKPLSLNFKA
jgi:hypothetical protein